MYEYLRSLRREIYTLIIVAIVLSLIVSLISRIIFVELYEGNEYLFSTLVLILFVVSIAGGFLILTHYMNKSKAEGFFVFVLNKEDSEFIDIPNSPPSVHARVSFNKLDKIDREHITPAAEIRSFERSYLSRFTNKLTQKILISIVLSNVNRHIDDKHIEYKSIDEIPDKIIHNKYLEDWACRNDNIPLPPNSEIKVEDDEKLHFSVESPHGYSKFTWGLGITNSSNYSEPYISLKDNIDEENCRDIISTVRLETEIKYKRILSPKAKHFASWASEISEMVKELDWSNTKSQFPTVILKNIAREM